MRLTYRVTRWVLLFWFCYLKITSVYGGKDGDQRDGCS